MTAINVGWWNDEQSFYMSFEKAMEKNNLYQGEIETPIQWLHRQSYDLDSDDKLTSDIFKIASEKQLILMEQFSKWLIDNKWEIDYRKGIWSHEFYGWSSISEIYLMFLKSKKA